MSHCLYSDFLAQQLEGTPLPCSCPACRVLVDGWEAGRVRQAGIAETLPPAFWTAQEARLREKVRGPAPFRLRVLAAAGAAALLIVGVGLGVVLTRGTVPAIDDYEARYAAIEEALERSAIGDLEACGVLLNESTEETSSTTEEEL